MKSNRVLNIQGAVLDKWQLEQYLEKLASDHVICNSSKRESYPIPRLIENYNLINSVYKLLNNHIKLGIPIHPAGEWLLDNLYIIEESVKNICKEMTLKKYTNFLGLLNGKYEGFARVYILALEMVAYTDGKIDSTNLEEMLLSYQNKKTLSMDEIWNIGLFIQIVLIENIRQICEKIYVSQMQKYRAENIVQRIIENKQQTILNKYKHNRKHVKIELSKKNQVKYSFIEYMSYRLKKYGKSAYPYLKILEEETQKSGNSIDEIIKKEHFDIAVKKVSIGNSITSLKNISRINFVEIFERINGVEDILRQDPSEQYDIMDANTKILYRNTIKEISKKTKLSEIYIAKKCLELSKDANGIKQKHIGYYLISDGKEQLLSQILNRNIKHISKKQKTKLYISIIWSITFIIDFLFTKNLFKELNLVSKFINIILTAIVFLVILLPIENIITKTIQYVLSKTVKPKPIPKLDFQNGIPEQYATMVVIPTILKSKQQVQELFDKLEVFYIANKSDNLYFSLLGDCTAGEKELEDFDNQIIEQGIECTKRLNEKYKDNKFYFIYRKRTWNEKEGKFLGWERKRGLINQFNEYMLKNIENPFRVNTIEKIPNIKYIITLDSDTDLTLNSGIELIGAMAHILNVPELNETEDMVDGGHALIAPRVGITLENARKSIYTILYSGQGGTDSYTNAISDLYQDNFDEGIFAGKGIYDLKVFSKVLYNEIKENTVLSHDLLEGCYLRSAFDSSVVLMDGYPSNYIAAKKRLYRWIRGDYQILWWLKNKIENKNGKHKKNPLNLLSKYKIISNIFRAKHQTAILALIIYSVVLAAIFKIHVWQYIALALVSQAISFLLDIINLIIAKKENSIRTKRFTREISGIKASFYRTILSFLLIPDNGYLALKAEIVTLYRMFKSKRNLLEWETAEEAEKNSKQTLVSYMQSMNANLIFGTFFLIIGLTFSINTLLKVIIVLLAIGWIVCPWIMLKISKKIKPKKVKLKEKSINFLMDIAYRTWQYFKDTLTEENNFLPPDNYQEDRKEKLIPRTSSTNIGLALLSVVAAYDLKYEDLEQTINLLDKMINTISSLQKWNGHLYNWYNIKTLEPLVPRYISSVDSGNFVGYLYVLLQFLKESKAKIIDAIKNKNKLNKVDRSVAKEKNLGNALTLQKIETMEILVTNIINNTDFSKLYDNKNRLFSVGYSVEENKLTESYYDLLASEARQTSLVAIAKKDVSSKHWNNLSRTLTTLNKYKGLISWSGTAFEYLMPNINIPNYEGSILDESSKFLIMSQKAYAKKLGVPWGFSEAAFNLKDLYNNYQYKAFGIPWLGLKRGLADEIVVSSYGTMLALSEVPEDVIDNINTLKEMGMYNKYGFYESVDFTPTRVKQKYEPVKTYMAHHQGLILLSIDNYFNNSIIQKRFMKNPEIQAVKILLEEKMPDNMVITKEEKEKAQKIKYIDYEDYCIREYKKIDENINRANVISNDQYTIVMDQYGNGYSKYKNIQINRYKETDDTAEGIIFYIKDIKNKRIWTNTYSKYLSKPDKYNIKFSPDMNKIARTDGQIETITKVITDADEPIEIRRIELLNHGITEETLEVTSYLEPILSEKMQDIAHKAFNNLFLSFEYLDTIDAILVKRNCRNKDDKSLCMVIKMYVEGNQTDTEFEIDKEKFLGRCNLNLPKMVENSIPLRRKIENVTDPIVALRKIITIKPEESEKINLIISVSENKEEAIKNINKYTNNENVKRMFEVSKARVEAETRYLGLKGKDISNYQNLLSYLIFPRKIATKKAPNKIYPTSNLWKYGISGDLPILLVKIKDVSSIDTVKECINAYEYYRSKNIQIDLVILNLEKESYESFVKDEVQSIVLTKNLGFLLNSKGGIYCLNNINEKEDRHLLEEHASFVIDADIGSIEQQLAELENYIKEKTKQPAYIEKNEYYIAQEHEKYVNSKFNENNLKYFNEYGGFSNNGKEYLIRVNRESKLPTVWSNILANKEFGTLTTESMGGYTWKNNSKLKRITAWNNDQVTDVPSEVIYLKDLKLNKNWSLGLNPMPDDNDYYITYGFGYSNYLHVSDGLEQSLDVFVPNDEPLKINLLHLTNRLPESKNIRIVYYIKPVLDEDEIKSNGKLNLEYNNKLNMIFLKNMANQDIQDKIFVSCSEKIKSYTGSKSAFFKNGDLSNPDGLEQIELSRENSYGQDQILSISFDVKIDALSTKDISIILGATKEISKCQDLAYKYSNTNNCKDSLTNTKKYWEDLINRLQVETPVESTNILLNGWLVYQTLASRLYGRTGFYQSGGAYGFRDQLQDSMSIKYFMPELTKEQILKHAAHQFIEGDVEHWWHEETGRGIRTLFSDDYLWLPYVTADYISFTGDYSILDEEVPFREGEKLKQGEIEKYDIHRESSIKGSLYEHCIKAIENGLKFGENGLPLIGSGDWNDSLSNVGVQGKGESIWLGFFLYSVLDSFIPICKYKKDDEKIEKYTAIMESLKKALNTNGWDGRWYKRAFMDSGEVLGSLQNEECRIDSISQSWSVISGAGDNDKKFIAMESLENHLVDTEIGVIKLLDPPFEKSKLEPGYIKAYIPGTRENGGQYTHGAIWAIIASAMLNLDEKAFEYFRMINPIEHTRTREAAAIYKVEPYVIAADVYTKTNMAGRGGWTWYTGSSSWFLLAGIKYILGINIKDGELKIEPHIPKNWPGYSVRFKYKDKIYNIKVEQTGEERKITINGEECNKNIDNVNKI